MVVTGGSTGGRTLHASGQETSTGQGSALELRMFGYQSLYAILDVTAAAAAGTDTLDVVVQAQLDGTNWADAIAFTQVLGNGGAVRHVGKLVNSAAESMFSYAASLSAGNVRNIVADNWRASWTIAGGGADFTFSVSIYRA